MPRWLWCVVVASLYLTVGALPVNAQDACPGGGSDPDPVNVDVEAVPIVVESTAEEYFVLYVSHGMETGATVEIPVSVTLGQTHTSTTTLSENVAPLPGERYRVEKYLVSDPADVDGDCVDDIAELRDAAGMNPVNPAAMEPSDGVVAIPDHATFERLDYQQVLKFVLVDMDTDRPHLYFVNATTHPLHQEFLDALGYDRGQEGLIVGWLVYSPQLVAPDGTLGVYRFSLSPIGTYSPPFSLVARTHTLLAAGMPLLEDNLAFHMPNHMRRHVRSDLPLYEKSRINVTFDSDVSAGASFTALNTGTGYGLLRVMEPGERPDPRDVVIYEALPNDLPRVAGIISAAPQTPLSHVNLRAVQDSVPNAFIRDPLDDTGISGLIGSYVRYRVYRDYQYEDKWDLRAATPAEVNAHHAASRPATAQTPQRDLEVTGVTALSDIGFDDWTAFGVKAANVAVLGALGFPEGTVPDGFAVPFYSYDEFMKHNGFYDDIEEMLADPEFRSDFDTQESELKKLRKKIKKGETPEWIDTALTEMHASFPEGTSLRYRSSTNNEDLPGFNGAGLYDSKTQHPDETEEDGIAKSLKQVYASLWNFRAFTEREFHRVDHLAAAMGVLVHPNYSDELANGVAVSFDPVYGVDGSYYVNTQVGEDLVTNPDARSVPEETLLGPISHTVLATSNQAPPGQLLMSDDQMDQLRDRLTVIHDHFAGLYNPAPGHSFAMETEFKITSDDILAIKQARPWVFPNQPPAFPATEPGARAIHENTAAGVDIGAPVAAVDPDTSDELTYSLSGADAASFDIVASTGQLRTRAALDHGAKESHTVTVAVHDGKDSSANADPAIDDTITVTITVNRPAAGMPDIIGTPRAAQTLTADVAGIVDEDGLDNAVFTYQWVSNDGISYTYILGETGLTVELSDDGADTDIAGATGSTLELSDDDVGKTMKVRVSFTDDLGYQETLTSGASAAVEARPDNSPATGAPAISGTARAGETLTADIAGIADEDGLDNAVFTYQWVSNDGIADTGIAGATGSTLELFDDDVGKTMKVRVSFTDGLGYEETLTSPATAEAVGTPRIPDELTGKAIHIGMMDLEWSDDPRAESYDVEVFKNVWTALPGNGIDIVFYGPGAIVSGLDHESRYYFRVRANNSFGSSDWSEYLFMPATATVSWAWDHVPEPANSHATGTPTISGTSQVGETLTASASDIEDENGLERVKFSYQWTRSDRAADADIADATDATYTLTGDDVGWGVKVRVAFTDRGGYQEALTSAATAVVQGDRSAWFATLTVGARDGFTGYSYWGDPHLGSLSATEVQWDGSAHYVRYVFLKDGELRLGLNEEMLSTGFVLSVGDEEFGSAQAAVDHGGASYRFRWDDPGLGWSQGDEVSVSLVQSDQNSPALGAPTISGSTVVGRTLTADVASIEDADGLDSVSFRYQWVRSDGITDVDIEDTTDATYTLTGDDVGRGVKVRVAFTDRGGYQEALTSAATEAVVADLPLPTVRLSGTTPTTRDGTNAFTFEIEFSEEVELSYRTLRDRAFVVSGGAVKKARRLDRPSNIRWQITVDPDSSEDVTIVLPATEDCAAERAICTGDGRQLSNRLEFTVDGPGQ